MTLYVNGPGFDPKRRLPAYFSGLDTYSANHLCLLMHVRPKPGDIPRKPERPTKHRPVLVRTIPIRSSQHPRPFPGRGGQPEVARRRAPQGTRKSSNRIIDQTPETAEIIGLVFSCYHPRIGKGQLNTIACGIGREGLIM